MKISLWCGNLVGAPRWLSAEEYGWAECDTSAVIEIDPEAHGHEGETPVEEWLGSEFGIDCPCCGQPIEPGNDAFSVVPDDTPVDYVETDWGWELADMGRRVSAYARRFDKALRKGACDDLETALGAARASGGAAVVFGTADGRFVVVPANVARTPGAVPLDAVRPVAVCFWLDADCMMGGGFYRADGSGPFRPERNADLFESESEMREDVEQNVALFAEAPDALRDFVRRAADERLDRLAPAAAPAV